VLPYMRRQRGGLLLHISSGAGRLVIPGFGFYCATKFAMEALGEAYHYELAGQGIESSIVEPGAYQTAVFGNFVIVADKARTDTYGAANQLADKVGAALAGSAGNAQEVADAVLRIVEAPAGKRELRYRVSAASMGVDEINALCASAQGKMLEAFGLSDAIRFVQRSAAGGA
jgi:short-subunit dehydrogenase